MTPVLVLVLVLVLVVVLVLTVSDVTVSIVLLAVVDCLSDEEPFTTAVHYTIQHNRMYTDRPKYFSVTTLKELFDTVYFEYILSFLRDIHLYSST